MRGNPAVAIDIDANIDAAESAGSSRISKRLLPLRAERRSQPRARSMAPRMVAAVTLKDPVEAAVAAAEAPCGWTVPAACTLHPMSRLSHGLRVDRQVLMGRSGRRACAENWPEHLLCRSIRPLSSSCLAAAAGGGATSL